MFFACHACHPGTDQNSRSIRERSADQPCERHCEHSWADVTEFQHRDRHLICTTCRATRQEPR